MAPGGYRPSDAWRPAAQDPGPPPIDQRQPGRPRPRRQGFLGGLLSALLAIWAFVKYGGLFLLKFGAFKTLLTLLLSFGLYAVVIGPWAAAGIVIMILVHEMGHVVEIRRQGIAATAPLFIPFLGAAIFQRSHPTDALKQAQIGIAGPLAGTAGAVVAFVLYGSTHSTILLFWAYFGFFINLINLIPAGFLDGGWILSVVSKWFLVAGLGALIVAVLVLQLSPIFLVIGLLGIPTAIERFRKDSSEYYRSVPVSARWAMAAAWLALVAFLGLATEQSHQLLSTLIG